jgi:hypothetical protein
MRGRGLVLSLAGGLASTAGCADEAPYRLVDLDHLSIQVSWFHATLGHELAEPDFSAQLGFSQPARGCATLVSTTTATVDGAPMVPAFLGGWVTIDSHPYCSVPTFVFPGAEVRDHRFEDLTSIGVSDGDVAIDVDARNLFAVRSIALESPTDGQLIGGQPAVVAWSPPTDRLDPNGVAVYFLPDGGPTGPTGDGVPAFILSGPDVMVEGNRIAFQVPPMHVGSGTLQIQADAAIPVERCRGFSRCAVAVYEVRRSVPARLP